MFLSRSASIVGSPSHVAPFVRYCQPTQADACVVSCEGLLRDDSGDEVAAGAMAYKSNFARSEDGPPHMMSD